MSSLWIHSAGLQGLLIAALGTGGGVALFGYGFVLWRRKRLIEDTPTARIRSMPLGRVELYGRASARAELTAPLSGVPCVYYRYQVEEEVGSGGRRRWRTRARHDSSSWPFYLEDGTGQVLVDPAGARVELRPDLHQQPVRPGDPLYRRLEDLGHARGGWLFGARRLRVSEWRIHPGDDLYVLGVAQERPGLARERRERVAKKLVALKRDPEAMARLDTDGDGRIDSEEWEVARRLALEAVDLAPVDDRVVIARAPHGESPFLLSDRRESSLVRSLTWRSLASIFGGALLSLVCLGQLATRLAIFGRFSP